LRKLTVGLIVGVLAVSFAPGALAATGGSIRETSIGSELLYGLFGIASGPDGNLWFPDQGCMGKGICDIVRLTPQGQFANFRRGLHRGTLPYWTVAGPDGNVWFTDEGRTPAIGRLTPAGKITEFSRGLRRGSLPFEIAVGADGDLWFTDQGRRPAIGRITPAGKITEFSRGLVRGSMPFGIAASPHGTLWFTDHGCGGHGTCTVGRATLSGRISELAPSRLRSGSKPLGIAAGPDHDMWFADNSGAIGRITPAGRVTELTRGLNPGSAPVGVTEGPDGDLWFTDEGSTTPAIGRVTPSGRIREFSAGLQQGSLPAVIVPAPDGKLWFTDEAFTVALGRVLTGARAALVTLPTISGRAAVGSALTCRAGRWATWAGVRPSADLFRFDGFQWLRTGVPIAGARGPRYTPTAADRGARLTCRETVTYKAPFLVTAVATSRAVRIRA
jgi:streptogramin lyase